MLLECHYFSMSVASGPFGNLAKRTAEFIYRYS